MPPATTANDERAARPLASSAAPPSDPWLAETRGGYSPAGFAEVQDAPSESPSARERDEQLAALRAACAYERWMRVRLQNRLADADEKIRDLEARLSTVADLQGAAGLPDVGPESRGMSGPEVLRRFAGAMRGNAVFMEQAAERRRSRVDAAATESGVSGGAESGGVTPGDVESE